ncbi:MAG: AI-2E family transporter [Bacteroidales bacterium]|nr:AI-2E family transporter [Candidatus Cryptobacteroides equifaecalis]
MEKKYTEKLAKYIIVLISLCIITAVCWYIRKVLGYIILAAVMTVLARPFFTLYSKIHIKKLKMPAWLATILSLVTVFSFFAGVVTIISPIIRNIFTDISTANLDKVTQNISAPLASLNEWLSNTFTLIGSDFRLEGLFTSEIKNFVDMSKVSSMVGSVTSFVADMGIMVFSVLFISFFFIMTPGLVPNIISAFVPDKMEAEVRTSLKEIQTLVTRYFIGMTIEVLGVTLVNFLGLLAIARMGFRYSLGIAFLTGMLNIVPYIGPLIGGVIGISLSMVIKYACATSFGLSIGFTPFLLVLIGIFVFTQMIDNYVYQPVIYSNSVKVHPLEIFIVFLIAGQIGGMVGMLAAIPAYTVLRVIAKHFLQNIKPINILTSEPKAQESK